MNPEKQKEEYYDNGQLKCRYTYNDKGLNGPYESYYPNGQLYERCIYKDGKNKKVKLEYSEKGTLISLTYYNQYGLMMKRWRSYAYPKTLSPQQEMLKNLHCRLRVRG